MEIIQRNAAEFSAVPSGDYESFCWDVTRDEFIRLMGWKPKRYERSFFNVGLFRIEPGFEVPSTDPTGLHCFCRVKVWRKWNKAGTKFVARIEVESTGQEPKKKR